MRNLCIVKDTRQKICVCIVMYNEDEDLVKGNIDKLELGSLGLDYENGLEDNSGTFLISMSNGAYVQSRMGRMGCRSLQILVIALRLC